MTRVILFPLSLSVTFLAGCGLGGMAPTRPVERPAPVSEVTPAVEEAVEEATPAIAPTAPSPDAGRRGVTIATLGDVTVPGLWLETPLVRGETSGQVIAENGQTLAVTLRPSGGETGSGSRISLAAMQALGIGLTELPTLTVLVDG